jgi:hypothetical protein
LRANRAFRFLPADNYMYTKQRDLMQDLFNIISIIYVGIYSYIVDFCWSPG